MSIFDGSNVTRQYQAWLGFAIYLSVTVTTNKPYHVVCLSCFNVYLSLSLSISLSFFPMCPLPPLALPLPLRGPCICKAWKWPTQCHLRLQCMGSLRLGLYVIDLGKERQKHI